LRDDREEVKQRALIDWLNNWILEIIERIGCLMWASSCCGVVCGIMLWLMWGLVQLTYNICTVMYLCS